MTLTQYNTTVGHTGIDCLCLAQKCYRTRTKLAEVGKPPPLQDATEKVVSLVSQGVKYMPKCSLIIKYC